uniref:Uncharacterized protein n=1 Tax=Cacopsylla melanoneura TaxID=428564 RepID=A0A8D8LJA6_9HEMI
MNSDGKLKNDTTIVSCSISLKILKEDSEIESPMCSKLKLKKNKNSNIITKKKSTLTIPCQEKWKWITNKLREIKIKTQRDTPIKKGSISSRLQQQHTLLTRQLTPVFPMTSTPV